MEYYSCFISGLHYIVFEKELANLICAQPQVEKTRLHLLSIGGKSAFVNNTYIHILDQILSGGGNK